MINFGNIHNAFSELMVESFIGKDSNKKKIFNTYLASIKENKVLKTQYLIYESISNKCETNDLKISEFIKETISLMDKYTVKDIKESETKTIGLLGKKTSLIECEYTNKTLHENINNLIVLGKTKSTKNIDTIVESFEVIFNYIKNNKAIESPAEVNENVTRLAITKFNEKYSSLDQSEFITIKTIIESDKTNEPNIFMVSVNECVDLIDKNLIECELETKEKLLAVKDKILRMKYCNETFITDVSKIIELKKSLI